jgi:hypothetical protein
MYASNSHSYTHLILTLGIVREPTIWGLLLQNTLAYMTLACLVVFLSPELSVKSFPAPVNYMHTRESLTLRDTSMTIRLGTGVPGARNGSTERASRPALSPRAACRRLETGHAEHTSTHAKHETADHALFFADPRSVA